MATLPAIDTTAHTAGLSLPWTRSGGSWTLGAGVVSPSSTWQNLDDDRDGSDNLTTSEADGDTGVGTSEGTAPGQSYEFSLEDMPGDFSSMDTATFRYSVASSGSFADDPKAIGLRIKTSGGTILAAESAGGDHRLIAYFDGSGWTSTSLTDDNGGVYSGGDGLTPPQYAQSFTFSYCNTSATKADWDDAVIELRWYADRSMGGDNTGIILVEASLGGTYSAGVAAQDLTLPLITDADTVSVPSVSVGAVALSLPLVTDSDTLYVPTVVGVQNLTLPAISGGTVEAEETSADFDAVTVGTDLGAVSGWAAHSLTVSGVLRADNHPDHSNLTRVIDFSAVGEQIAVQDVALSGVDQYAELDVFLDSPASTIGNRFGVVLRGSDASPDGSTWDGFLVFLRKVPDGAVTLEIREVTNGSLSAALATSADLSGSYPGTSRHLVRAEIEGSTIRAYVAGNLELTSTGRTEHTSGLYSGIYGYRSQAALESQPFCDDFSAGTLGVGGNTLHAPSVSQVLSLALPAVSDGDTLYAPSVAAGSVSLGLPALSDSDTLHEPAVAPGAVSVALPIVSDGDSVHAPTIDTSVGVTLPALADGDTVHVPSLTAGAVGISLPSISDADAVHALTVSQGAGAPQGLTLPVLSDSDALYAPSVTPGAVSVVLPALSDSDTLHVPSVAPGAVSVGLPFEVDGDTLHVPTVSQGASPSQAVGLPALTDSDTLYVPSVAPGAVSVLLPALSDSDTLYVPSAAPGAVSVLLPALTDSDTLYVPSVEPGAVSVSLPFEVDGDTLYAPTVSSGGVAPQAVALPSISDGDSLHALTVQVGAVSVSLPLISDGDSVHAPSLGAGALSLVLPTIADGDSVHAPSVEPGLVLVTLPALDSTAQVFLPGVTVGPVAVELPALASTEAPHAPIVRFTALVEFVGTDLEPLLWEFGLVVPSWTVALVPPFGADASAPSFSTTPLTPGWEASNV